MGINLTFRVISKPDSDPDTEVPIQLRIRSTDGSTETTLNSGSKIPLRYWKNGNVVPKYPSYTTVSRQLTKIRQDIEEIVVKMEEENIVPNPSIVRRRYEKERELKDKNSTRFLSYEECWEKFLNKKRVESSPNTLIMYRMLYERLRDFSSDTKVKMGFDYLTSLDFETDFKQWSWEVRNHRNSFVRKNLTSIKSFLNFCVNNGLVDIKLRNYQKPKELEKVEVVFLTKEEVLKLHNFQKYDISSGSDFPPSVSLMRDLDKNGDERFFTNYELTRDLFLFMCVIGCRWGDLHTLTWDSKNFDNETFTWENQKTKKFTTVPLDKIGIDILKKYGKGKNRTMKIFPKYSQVKFNKLLKKICKEVNLNRLVSISTLMGTRSVNTEKKPLYEVISSHSGRRTFIMNLLSKGIDYKTIMTMTGHSDVKSLMKYVSVGSERIELGRDIYSDSGSTKSQFESLFDRLSKEEQEKVIDYMKLYLR